MVTKAETDHSILPFPRRAPVGSAPDNPACTVLPFPDRYWTPERIAKHLSLATKALPFVKVKDNDQPGWLPENYWAVTPTGQFIADRDQGREYARLAVDAMRADHTPGLLGWIVHDMVKDAVASAGKRQRKTGGAIRMGFMDELGAILIGRGT
jgi:hypothetical protein